jgi:hypothetical protein
MITDRYCACDSGEKRRLPVCAQRLQTQIGANETEGDYAIRMHGRLVLSGRLGAPNMNAPRLAAANVPVAASRQRRRLWSVAWRSPAPPIPGAKFPSHQQTPQALF